MRYAAPVVAVGAAIILAHLVEREWHSSPVVSLLFLAIMISAWSAGVWPGLLAVILSVLAFDYFFLAPAASFFYRFG
jgi:K+-sensing histidine kinase KdpD